jgi:hypothetical protein
LSKVQAHKYTAQKNFERAPRAKSGEIHHALSALTERKRINLVASSLSPTAAAWRRFILDWLSKWYLCSVPHTTLHM